MSSSPVPDHRLSAATMIMAGVLLVIPLAGLAIVPVYSRHGPQLWGMPFFYWYQFAWVFLASGFTYLAYLVIARARRRGAQR